MKHADILFQVQNAKKNKKTKTKTNKQTKKQKKTENGNSKVLKIKNN